MILPQQFLIDARPVVVAVDKALRNKAHQVRVARIVFREQHQMVVTFLCGAGLPVKA